MLTIDREVPTTATAAIAPHFVNGQPGLPLATPAIQEYAPEAWFLGPLGENAAEFERLVVEALRDHVFWRRNFHPGDRSPISEANERPDGENMAAGGEINYAVRAIHPGEEIPWDYRPWGGVMFGDA